MFSSYAMKLNGVYIEDLIDGYTTLSVEGRDALEMTEETEDVGVRPGTLFKRKKYSARTLVVNFAIEGDDTTEIRTKGRELQYTLNTGDEECEIIFDDENDVFYKGIPIGGVSFSIVPMHGTGNAIGTGSFNILCADPFKYSVEEFVVESDREVYINTEDGPDEDMMDEFVIDYNGTYPAYPTFVANMYNAGPYGKRTGWYINDTGMGLKKSTKEKIDAMGSCGFLAFIKTNDDDDAKVLQFGDPDFQRYTEIKSSKQLVNEYYQMSSSWDKHSSKWENFDNLYSRIGIGASGDFTFERDRTSTFAPAVKSSVKQNTISLYGWTYNKKLKKNVYVLHNDFTDSVKETENNKTLTNKYFKFYDIYVTSMERTSATNLKVKLSVSAQCLKKITGKNARSIIFYISINGSDYKEQVLFKNKKTIDKGSKITRNFTFNVELSGATVCLISGSNIKIKTASTEGSAGNVKAKTCNNLVFNTYEYHADSGYYLSCDGYGVQDYSGFHGPVLFREIPIDPLDDECKQWYFTCKPLFGIGSVKSSNIANKKRKGALLIGVADDNNVLMGYYLFVKTSNNTDKAKVYYGQHNSATKYIGSIDVKGAGFNNEVVIKKTKTYIDFKVTSKLNPKPVYMSSSNRGKYASNATKIVVGMFQYKSEPVMFKNGIEYVKFKKYRTNNDGDELIEIDNEPPFSGGDTLMADTSSCEVLLNGREIAEIGALGNDWDGMCLERGLNVYGAYASNFFTLEEVLKGKANSVMRQCTKDDPYKSFMIRCQQTSFIPCYDVDTGEFAEFDPVNNPLYIKLKSGTDKFNMDDETGESFVQIDNIRDEETYRSYPYEYFYNKIVSIVPYDENRKYFTIKKDLPPTEHPAWAVDITPAPDEEGEMDESYRDSIISAEQEYVGDESYYEAHARYLYYRTTNPIDLYYKAYSAFSDDIENAEMKEFRLNYKTVNGKVYKDVANWSETKHYRNGTKVQNNDKVYSCIRYGMISLVTPADSGLWTKVSVRYLRNKLIKNVVSFINCKYVSKSSWSVNDICTHKGVPYICLKAFKKSDTVPSGKSFVPGNGVYTDYWRKLNMNSNSDLNKIYLSKSTDTKQWSETKIYCNGDLCAYNNQTYILKNLTYTVGIKTTDTKYWKLLGEASSYYHYGEEQYYELMDDLYSRFNPEVLKLTEYYSDLEQYIDSDDNVYFNCGELYRLSKGVHAKYNPQQKYYDEAELHFKTAYPSRLTYMLHYSRYYTLGIEKPEFKIKYREVFI